MVFTQDWRLAVTTGVPTVDTVTVELPRIVEGNQGEENLPIRSADPNQMFLELRLAPLFAWFAIRPPTMVSVPTEFH